MSRRAVTLEPGGLYRLEPADDRGRVEAGVYALAGAKGELLRDLFLEKAVDGDPSGGESLHHEEELSGPEGEAALDRHEIRLTGRLMTRAVGAPSRRLTVGG